MSDFHAGKAEYLASSIIELDRSSSSCVWTAELWVILHVQAPKPKGDKYKGFVVSSFEAALRLDVFFFFLTACRYLKSSQLLSVVPHLSAPSLSSVCLSGSIAIIVPLVLLVILIVVVVTGVYVCRRRQR